ncbi:hypothetical protein, partial [Shewanella marina]|uniref:hypothetical protein n=1 Tax=Shewanella marina TaxID=487319 RepID=UPI001F3720D6
PNGLKLLLSEALSQFNSRRIYVGMVIPFQVDTTTKWTCLRLSLMGFNVFYTALLILLRE